MRTFDRILDIQQRGPGNWHVRFSHKDGAEEGSEFIKIRSSKLPTHAEIMAEVSKTINLLNNPPQPPSIIPDSVPDIVGLTAAQRVTLSAIWTQLRTWLRQLIGRR